MSRDFQDIRILIPGYSIEDLPTDLNEPDAASLLNAFAVAWHPWLLNRASSLPQAYQAESTELPTGQHIVLVPQCSEDWLAHDWKDQLSDTMSATIDSCSARSEWVQAINDQFAADQAPIPVDLLQDFYSLGTNHLLVNWLSRRMHHFVEPDLNVLEAEAFAAAESAAAGDVKSAREHLRRSFECLLDCREQFQPTDCFLLDICLPSEQTTARQLHPLICDSAAISLICSGQELQDFCQADEQLADALTAAVNEGRLTLLTGQHHELRTSLGSLSTVFGDTDCSRRLVEGIAPGNERHWARRRFGMTSSLPSLLDLFDFSSALHIVLDDGIYPDREYGQLEWQAPDGSTISAVSRIPMAIDGSSSFLRFVDRFTESMQEDSTAVMLLARLPDVQTPWLNDLKRAVEYAPVLGRFVTMNEFAEQTCGQASPTKFSEGEYLSPYLIQSSVLKTEAPISSPAALHAAHGRLDASGFLHAVATVLKPKAAETWALQLTEARLAEEEATRLSLESERGDTSAAQTERLASVSADITVATESTIETIFNAVPKQGADARGTFLVNPLPWKQTVSVSWPASNKPPAENECIAATWLQDKTTHIEVNLPAGGFAWVHEETGGRAAVKPDAKKGKALAEPLLLRNKFFEVQLSDRSGGIAGVIYHGQRGNRVSQQIAFRYEQSKTITVEDEEMTLAYATSRLLSTRIIAAGPFWGSIETTCEILDVATGSVLAKYRQTTSVERNSPRLHIRIEFDDLSTTPTGNPWMTYYAARIAWDNETASIVRSCLGQAAGFRMERFEAPDYVEVADHDHRLLILPHGRPYHRRSGHRMLDSLLMVEGEDVRTFDLTLEFDQPYPMRSALEVQCPAAIRETSGTVPAAAASGWILGLSARNVVAARTRVTDATGDSGDRSVTLLLQETEGSSATCRIRTARRPKSALLRKATGEIIQELPVTDTGTMVEFTRFQIKLVELTF